MVEWCLRNPCCVFDSGIWSLIFECIIFSSVLEIVDNKDIGLYEAGDVGGLFGFNIVIMCACFHVGGIMLFSQE